MAAPPKNSDAIDEAAVPPPLTAVSTTAAGYLLTFAVAAAVFDSEGITSCVAEGAADVGAALAVSVGWVVCDGDGSAV